MNRYILAASLVGLLACDEFIEVSNAAPVVQATYCQDGERSYFQIQLQDREEDFVDLTLHTNGEPAHSGPTGDGLIGLPTDRHAPGRLHLVEWDCSSCPSTVDLQIEAVDEEGSTSTISASLTRETTCDHL